MLRKSTRWCRSRLLRQCGAPLAEQLQPTKWDLSKKSLSVVTASSESSGCATLLWLAPSAWLITSERSCPLVLAARSKMNQSRATPSAADTISLVVSAFLMTRIQSIKAWKKNLLTISTPTPRRRSQKMSFWIISEPSLAKTWICQRLTELKDLAKT